MWLVAGERYDDIREADMLGEDDGLIVVALCVWGEGTV